MTLIDKQLSASSGYSLTNSGDFAIVENEASTLQAAQNRILAELDSWIYDDEYGGLLVELRNTPIQSITNTQVRGFIERSLQPLLDANRLLSIVSVTIIEKREDSIQVEVKLDLDLAVGVLNINIAT